MGGDQPRPAASDPVVAIYRVALPQVFGYLLPRCGSAALAEDLTSETFLAAVNASRQGSLTEVSTAWLVGVARHKLVDHWRRSRARAAQPGGRGRVGPGRGRSVGRVVRQRGGVRCPGASARSAAGGAYAALSRRTARRRHRAASRAHPARHRDAPGALARCAAPPLPRGIPPCPLIRSTHCDCRSCRSSRDRSSPRPCCDACSRSSRPSAAQRRRFATSSRTWIRRSSSTASTWALRRSCDPTRCSRCCIETTCGCC